MKIVKNLFVNFALYVSLLICVINANATESNTKIQKINLYNFDVCISLCDSIKIGMQRRDVENITKYDAGLTNDVVYFSGSDGPGRQKCHINLRFVSRYSNNTLDEEVEWKGEPYYEFIIVD